MKNIFAKTKEHELELQIQSLEEEIKVLKQQMAELLLIYGVNDANQQCKS